MSKKIPDMIGILRLTGRLFEAGKPIDLASLRQSIEGQRKQRPALCGVLTDIIQKAEDATALGDRPTAMKHYRAAIDAACEMET